MTKADYEALKSAVEDNYHRALEAIDIVYRMAREPEPERVVRAKPKPRQANPGELAAMVRKATESMSGEFKIIDIANLMPDQHYGSIGQAVCRFVKQGILIKVARDDGKKNPALYRLATKNGQPGAAPKEAPEMVGINRPGVAEVEERQAP